MPATYAYTHQNPDGNRYLKGQSDLPNAQTLDIKLALVCPGSSWRHNWALGASGSQSWKTAQRRRF